MSINVSGGTSEVQNVLWYPDEVTDLIGVWRNYNNQLEKMSHKKTIFMKMAEDISRMGREKDWKQVQKKVQSLKDTYKKVKPKKTGDEPPSWPYFHEIHKIIGQRPYYNPEKANCEESGLPGPSFRPTSDPFNDSIESSAINTSYEEEQEEIDVVTAATGTTKVTDYEKRKKKKDIELNRKYLKMEEETIHIMKEFLDDSRKYEEKAQMFNAAALQQFGNISTTMDKMAESVAVIANCMMSNTRPYQQWNYGTGMHGGQL